MFEDDICLCGDANKCPLKDTCKRAERRKTPGIYTVPNFFQFYKEGYGCEYYWGIKEADDND